jgi:hypothetical protein
MKKSLSGAVVLGILALGSPPVEATVIDFEDVTGPSLFADTVAPQPLQYTFGTLEVDVTGGVILDQTANLPANQTSVYGTASFCCGTGTTPNLITVTFSSAIENFFLDVLNGLTDPVTYRMSDNNGNVADFVLEPNLSSGQTQIGFAATGTIVTIQAITGLPSYDFFVDNIHFNEELPPGIRTPEPSTALLLAFGFAAALARRRKRTLAP